jgi:hypothetical protein
MAFIREIDQVKMHRERAGQTYALRQRQVVDLEAAPVVEARHLLCHLGEPCFPQHLLVHPCEQSEFSLEF